MSGKVKDIPMDAKVQCTDGKCGKSTFVIVNPVKQAVTHFVVKYKKLPDVDATGAAAVTGLFACAQRYDVELPLARVHSATHELLKVAGVIDEIGEGRIYDTVRSAVDAATLPNTAASDETPTNS